MGKPCSLLMGFTEGCLHPSVCRLGIQVSQILPWDANPLIANQGLFCWSLRCFLAVQTSKVVPFRRGTSFLPMGICRFWGCGHAASKTEAPCAARWVGRMQPGLTAPGQTLPCGKLGSLQTELA